MTKTHTEEMNAARQAHRHEQAAGLAGKLNMHAPGDDGQYPGSALHELQGVLEGRDRQIEAMNNTISRAMSQIDKLAHVVFLQAQTIDRLMKGES